MQNFNTNQARHFYVAGVDKTGSTISGNLDIQVKKTATDEIYFVYKNADGLLTRSDTINLKKIKDLSKTAAANMARPLMAHKVAVNTSAVTLANLVGKTVDCIITIHGLFDYDDSNSTTFVASVVGNSTNTASAAAFHKDLAIAIAKALPKPDKNFPLIRVYSNGTEVTASTAAGDVTGASSGVVLVEGLQKYVRGKLSGEPCHFSVAFRYATATEDVVWGTDAVKTVAAVNAADTTSIAPVEYPANYVLADLEYFALGERGDVYRGAMWPNDYTPTYAINPNSGTYDVLNIEYFWAGNVENVQKSPRLIQIAAPVTGVGSQASSAVDSLLATIQGFIDPASGSGAGA